jgi:1,4-dihydroxy-2-naphthoate octaprenyltransferase
MKRAMVLCGSLAFASGVALLMLSLGLRWSSLALFLVGILAIAAAVKYTFGSNPYGYAGLGDLSVFLFFGIVGVCGTYYLILHGLYMDALWPAIAFGLLSAGVLNVNNMRDIANDSASGKRTLAVRLGARRARTYHTGLILGGMGSLLVYGIRYATSPMQWLFLPALVIPLVHLRAVHHARDAAALDPQLRVLALGTSAIAVLFFLGHLLA